MKIVIVGAGIGGLTLANALITKLPKDACELRIFEREANADDRSQGYALTLRGDMGLKALDAIGFGEERKPLSQPSRSFYFTTPGGWNLMCLGGSDPSSPYYQCRVERPALRRMLLSRLPPQSVVWGTQAVGYRQEGDRAVVVFADGTEEQADVVVACDGARSKLRTQMLGPDDQMLDVALINGRVEAAPFVCKYLNNSATLFCVGNGSSVFASMNEATHAGWSFAFNCPAGSLKALSKEELHQRVKDTVSSWKQEPIARMVSATDPSTVTIRELVDRKCPSVARDGRVVLLGDACHPMTPYLGLGANSAMLDAVSLAESIARHSGNLPDALAEFEQEMLKRAVSSVKSSRNACLSYHRPGWIPMALRNAALWSMGTILSFIPKRTTGAETK